MDLNDEGTHRRTAADEAEDQKLTSDNLLKQSWKSWPNKAGFDGLEEHRGPVELAVKGSIPSWAAGTLYRTGPGACRVEDTPRGTHEVSHWFDGLAMSYAFNIARSGDGEGATVSLSSRRNAEALVNSIKTTGRRTGFTFAQRADPCVGIFGKLMSVFQPAAGTSDSGRNINVVVQPNIPGGVSKLSSSGKGEADAAARTGTRNLFVGTDNAILQELHPDTLEPVGTAKQASLHRDLKGPMSCAHALRDPETGDYFNYNLDLTPKTVYRVFRTNAASGTTDILATFSDPGFLPAYIHSFFLTDNYVVLCAPTTHFALAGAKIVWKRNILEAIEPFDRAKVARWIVVDRRHGRGVVARFSTPASFFFHSVNAFEEQVQGGDDDGTSGAQTDICLDHIMYDNTDIMFAFYYDVILDRDGATKKHYLDGDRHRTSQPRFVRYRFRIPPAGGEGGGASTDWSAVAEEAISIPNPHAGELPTINPLYACKPYRYLYSGVIRGRSSLMDSIAKTDLQTRDALIWVGPEGHSPGEPVFVPRPGATDEDDGVVLCVVLDGHAGRSYLLCLDAKTMKETGRAEADFAVGMGFHGVHRPAL